MANRRMISRGISVSEQVNGLSDFAALLFTWLIPHTDDYGVIPGSSRKIKALVVPMRKQSAEQVEAALKEMQSAGLIWRYIYLDKEYLQFCKFEEHQEGLHKRTSPKNPLYAASKEDAENFREIPGNSRLIEQNRTEGKGKEQNWNKTAFAHNVHLLDQEYERLIKDHGKELTDAAIQYLSDYKIEKAYTTKDDNRTIRRWVLDAVKKKQPQPPQQNSYSGVKLG